jgi:hypothetical protein
MLSPDAYNRLQQELSDSGVFEALIRPQIFIVANPLAKQWNSNVAVTRQGQWQSLEGLQSVLPQPNCASAILDVLRMLPSQRKPSQQRRRTDSDPRAKRARFMRRPGNSV